MDMGRTCVNLIGNCLATVVVARWEGEFDDDRAKVFGTPEEAARISNPAMSLLRKPFGKTEVAQASCLCHDSFVLTRRIPQLGLESPRQVFHCPFQLPSAISLPLSPPL
jgi:hypothetical protein